MCQPLSVRYGAIEMTVIIIYNEGYLRPDPDPSEKAKKKEKKKRGVLFFIAYVTEIDKKNQCNKTGWEMI